MIRAVIVCSHPPEGVGTKTNVREEAEAVTRAKRALALLLCVSVLLCLYACGSDNSRYRVLSTVGQRSYALLFRLDDRLAEPVTAAMDVLAGHDHLAQICRQWLHEDRITLRGNVDALDELDEPPQPRVLIAGVEANSPPLGYSEGDGYAGMSVDIARELASLLGWEVRIQPIAADEVDAQLASGNIDCAVGFDPLNANTEHCSVARVYMESDLIVAVPRDSDCRSMRDLRGLKIASVRDNAALTALKNDKNVSKYVKTVVSFVTPERCMYAMDNGSCAAVSMDRLVLDACFY